MKKIKIHMPLPDHPGDEVSQIVRPGIEESNLCELHVLPWGIGEKDGIPFLRDPIVEGNPEGVDVILLHGIMGRDRANLWRKQYPDLPCFVLDYKDSCDLHMTIPNVICYFKRSMAYRHLGNILGVKNYFPNVVHHSSYCVREDIVKKLSEYKNLPRDIDVSCFFDPLNDRYSGAAKGWVEFNQLRGMRLKMEDAIGHSDYRRLCPTILKMAQEWYGCNYKMHIGKTHSNCVEGRQTPQDKYVETMARSKIIVSAMPDGWEGDFRLMEAISSGALLLHNRMQHPPIGLVDKKHWVLYDDHEDMLDKVYYYLKNPNEAAKIANRGKDYVMNNHRPVHRVEQWLRVCGLI